MVFVQRARWGSAGRIGRQHRVERGRHRSSVSSHTSEVIRRLQILVPLHLVACHVMLKVLHNYLIGPLGLPIYDCVPESEQGVPIREVQIDD